MPRYFDEQIANMRAGLARGFTVPRVSVVGRDKTIEPYVKGDTTNPLYAPFTQMPATISAADQAAMRAEAATVIRDVVAPAYARLLTMMRDEYLPKARTTLAAIAMPDGEAYYQAMIEKFTTLTLTAQQIHDIGLKEVARIEAEMEATKQRASFTGTMAEFFHVPAHRPAVLREDAARAARPTRRTCRRRPTGSSPRRSACCRAAGTASAPFPTRSRRSTPAAAAGSKRA